MLCDRQAFAPRQLLAAALALLTIAGWAATASAQSPANVLDHFRCYTVLFGPDAGLPVVFLQDQFDIKRQITEEVVVIGPPNRFCNPVEKTIEDPLTGTAETTPITDRDHHLALYRIQEVAVHRPVSWTVVVRNQFGTQKLVARRPTHLAVPTHKIETGLNRPEGLDHFKCYAAYGKEVGLKASLTDQFEGTDVLVLDPKLFCNPTRKVHSTTVVPVQNATAHLTCYDIVQPAGSAGFVTTVDRVIANQFGEGDIVAVTDEDLLCVPSRKVSFTANRGPAADLDITGR